MSFTPGNIIQYSENYPFLPIAIRMQTANSWTRENTTGNNFLGNGGTELNTTSNLYDLAYRNYDPILGRMNQIDPMATKYASLTPYNFSFNDPVTFTDPSGADPEYGITRYTYDDRVDHYRGQFYSGGSTSALRFHTGGRSGGITNWSYAPSFGQLQHAAAASANPQALMQQYGLQYGKSYSYQKFGSIEAGAGVYDQYDWVMNAPGDPPTQQTQGGDPFGFKDEFLINSYYTQRDNGVNWYTLTAEFLSGNGPERSLFLDGHPMTEAIKKSTVVSQAIIRYIIGGQKPLIREHVEANPLIHVPLAGFNMMEQFVGSARISIIPSSAGTIFILNNTTGNYSGGYDSVDDIPRIPGEITPHGNIYQRFIWIVPN